VFLRIMVKQVFLSHLGGLLVSGITFDE